MSENKSTSGILVDYSKLSDADINARVGETLGWNAKSIHPDDSVTFRDDLGRLRGRKNYCNNAADAWQIIMKSRINIEFDLDETFAWGYDQNAQVLSERDRKTFRAAMIVFLMMQESE